MISTVELEQGGLASSGDFQRCMVIDAQRYSHLLDPTIGWPVRGLRAVSVVGPHCLIAGSTSTIAMLKGEEGKAWLDSTGLTYIRVAEQGECYSNALPVSNVDRIVS